MTKPITHLTQNQHREVARLLILAQESLTKAAEIVARAPYVDQSLRAKGVIQDILIDPLRDGWLDTWSDENPYPSVGYLGPSRQRLLKAVRG